MRTLKWSGLAVVAACLLASAAPAATFTGGLQYIPPASVDDDLTVNAGGSFWPSYIQSIGWTITDEEPTGAFAWKYTYTWKITNPDPEGKLQGGLSHLIIEVSNGFTAADIYGLTGASVSGDIGPQLIGSGNPGMPADMESGIRFTPLTTPAYAMEWSFWSTRAPVWGDFYAKDGGANYSWNTGFLTADPTDAPANGTVSAHILRPDTETTVVPEWGSLALGALALPSIVAWRRARRQ